MDKGLMLNKIAKEIEGCKICVVRKSGKAVPGEGNPKARIVFVGEAPGKKEAATGRPFVGRSGQLLRSLIREIGLNEEDVFITSPVKYLPDQGTPVRDDILHGRMHLQDQLDVIRPKIIVLLGAVACYGVLGEKIPIIANHGKILHKAKDDRMYFVTFHPSAALRFPPLKQKLTEDFSKLRKAIQK